MRRRRLAVYFVASTSDVTFCEYGYDDGAEHLNDVTLARKESGVKVFFGGRL